MGSLYRFIICILVVISTHATAKDIDTIVIGDSIFAWSDVPKNLRDGGLEFDMLAVAGSKIESIANQYRKWRDANGVPRVVIMDGGGNDVIRGGMGDCLTRNDRCIQLINRILVTEYNLIDEMYADGVDRMIFVGIHHLGPLMSSYRWAVDIAMDELSITLPVAPLPIAFVDLREPFKTRNDLVMIDAIHLTKTGAKVVSDLILEHFDD